MSRDLHTLLRDAAPRPSIPFDESRLVGKALRQRTIMRAGAAAAVVVTVAALAVFGAEAFRDPGTVHVADQPPDCPVTIPSGDFVPPPPYPTEPAADGNAWYGTPELWTALPVGGQYPTRKSVWWSARFPGGQEEERPDITVTWERLDEEQPVIVEDGGTNAHTTADGRFMIAGIDPDVPGCWKVTATYRGAELSYVYFRPAIPGR